MRPIRIVLACGGALVLAVPAAYAATGTDGTHTLTLGIGIAPAKTSAKGKPKAVALDYKHVFTRDDGARATAEFKRLSVTLAKGFTVDSSTVAQCKESIVAKSSKGCPSASVVGTGKAIADARPAAPDPINAPVRVINGIEEKDSNGKPLPSPRDGLFVVATVGTAEIYFVAEIRGNKLVVDFPKPTSSDPGPYIIKEISFKLRALRKGSKAFLASPTTCPKRGWAFSETDEFYSGAKTVTARDTVKCS